MRLAVLSLLCLFRCLLSGTIRRSSMALFGRPAAVP